MFFIQHYKSLLTTLRVNTSYMMFLGKHSQKNRKQYAEELSYLTDGDEDKFHEISNWLGYQYLTYKNTTFYKWLCNHEHEDLIHSNILNLKDTIGDPREIN